MPAKNAQTPTITLPQGFTTFTPAQRKAWARQEIEAVALEMLADVGAMHGKVPSQEQREAYLRNIAPGIDAALAGVAR